MKLKTSKITEYFFVFIVALGLFQWLAHINQIAEGYISKEFYYIISFSLDVLVGLVGLILIQKINKERKSLSQKSPTWILKLNKYPVRQIGLVYFLLAFFIISSVTSPVMKKNEILYTCVTSDIFYFCLKNLAKDINYLNDLSAPDRSIAIKSLIEKSQTLKFRVDGVDRTGELKSIALEAHKEFDLGREDEALLIFTNYLKNFNQSFIFGEKL